MPDDLNYRLDIAVCCDGYQLQVIAIFGDKDVTPWRYG
jgi:hypothetical protein